jgi:hypothetical protein
LQNTSPRKIAFSYKLLIVWDLIFAAGKKESPGTSAGAFKRLPLPITQPPGFHLLQLHPAIFWHLPRYSAFVLSRLTRHPGHLK